MNFMHSTLLKVVIIRVNVLSDYRVYGLKVVGFMGWGL
jgi:hypothetical protein